MNDIIDDVETSETMVSDDVAQQEIELEDKTESEDSIESKESKEQKAVVQDDTSLEITQEEFIRLKLIIESILMASDKPISIKNLTDIFNTHNEDEQTRVRDKVKFNKRYINLALDELNTDLEDRAVEIKFLASGYRMQTKPEYAVWVQKLWQEKPSRYSKATLETLAIIAYRQPITRGEIEHIRGVAVSSHIIRNLLDREWVKVVGHKEVPGKPAIYATTAQFLTDLNLEKLEDLPTLADIKEIKQDLFADLEKNPELENQDGDNQDEIEDVAILAEESESVQLDSKSECDAVAEDDNINKDQDLVQEEVKQEELID